MRTLGLFAVRLAFFAVFSLTVLAILTGALLAFAVVVALGVTLAVIVTVSGIAVSLTLTVLGATGTVAAVVVALTAVILARRVVATARTRSRADGAATRRTVTAVTTITTVATLTARRTTSIEAPGSRGRGSGPLSGEISLLSSMSKLNGSAPQSSILRCG